MAKKSRTSNKKSNDSQKKLLALVLIILFIGLGVFLVVSSFAAKGGNKGKPGTLVDSPYGLIVEPSTARYGSSVNLYATDKNTGQKLTSLPETEILSTSGYCYYNNTLVGGWGKRYTIGYTVGLINPTLSNGAICTAYLEVWINGSAQKTAEATFTVTP